MSQAGLKRWGLALSFLARAFVAAFAGIALYWFFDDQTRSFFPHAVKLMLFAILVVWRFQRRKVLFFIPDEMLLALPWLWLVSLSAHIDKWHTGWVVVALLIAVLSAISRPFYYAWFKGGIAGNSLYAAVIISAVFYFSFAVLLNRVFADFTRELLIRSLQGGIWIFAGIFIMNAAFHQLLPDFGKKNQSTVAAVESHDAA